MDQLQKTMISNQKEEKQALHPLNNLIQEKKFVENLFPNFTIFFATQSNTAKKFSEKIAKDAEFLNIKTKVKNISELNPEEDLNKNALVLFFVATYGEGGPSDDAIEFNRALDDRTLFENFTNEGLRYAVFGLGSTKYEFFNQMAKKIDKKFSKRGLKNTTEIGLGDDSKNINKDFENWRKNFWVDTYNYFLERQEEIRDLSHKLNLKEQYEVNEEEFKVFMQKEGERDLAYSKEKEKAFDKDLALEDFDFRTKRYLNAVDCEVTDIKELRKETVNGSTLLITYNCEKLDYKTGDNIGIYPKNSMNFVNEICQKFNFEKNEKIIIKKRSNENLKKKYFIPNGLTVEEILIDHVDLSAQIT